MLFGHLAKIAKENNCGRLEWRVLKVRRTASVVTGTMLSDQPGILTQWNAPSIAFYQQVLGAVEQSEWKGMRLEGVAISKLEKYLEGRN